MAPNVSQAAVPPHPNDFPPSCNHRSGNWTANPINRSRLLVVNPGWCVSQFEIFSEPTDGSRQLLLTAIDPTVSPIRFATPLVERTVTIQVSHPRHSAAGIGTIPRPKSHRRKDPNMRLLMATDQPFWQPRGGAQQRIGCLWAALQTQLPATPAETTIFYLGNPQELPAAEQTERLGGIIVPPYPPNRGARPGSQSAAPTATPSRWWSWLRPRPPAEPIPAAEPRGQASPAANGLTLADYRWPWVASHFRQALRDHRPDVVLLEYVTMTYLIGMATPQQRQRILWVVDTHDCLSHRQQQFAALGQPHWLQITEAEETQALRAADLVIAIQDAEARWFAPRIAPTRVVVAGHAPITPGPQGATSDETFDSLAEPTDDTSSPDSTGLEQEPKLGQHKLILGCLASDNFPNRQGVFTWLANVAESLVDLPVQLCFAGTICRAIQVEMDRGQYSASLANHISLLGPVAELAEFYRRVDVVINPIELGTGLKIKSVEALAYGCPLLASPHAAGDLPGNAAGLLVCDSPAAWRAAIESFIEDSAALANARAQARDYAEQQLTPQAVYQAVVREIQAGAAAKNT